MVLSNIADQNIRIETDHRERAAPFAIARSISSSDTGLVLLPLKIPFSSRTDPVAGTMENSLFPISTNSTRSPGSKPSALRILAGMVICPLDVTVAEAIAITYYYRSGSFAVCRLCRARQHSDHDSRWLGCRVIYTLGGFHEVRGLGVGDVDEGLRVAIGEREP